jgi:hypothetical protein
MDDEGKEAFMDELARLRAIAASMVAYLDSAARVMLTGKQDTEGCEVYGREMMMEVVDFVCLGVDVEEELRQLN